MSLIRSFEREGDWLFRKRSYIPIVLFILVIPFVFTTDYSVIATELRLGASIFAIAVSALGFAIRIYTVGTAPAGTSGRNRGDQQAEALNTTGMYSIVRHPLYLGNYLIWSGIVIYTLNPYFFVIVSLLYWLYYERIMIAEEKHLDRAYGDEFLRWSERVPAFIPSFSKFKHAALSWSWKAVLPREENGVLATVIAYLYVDTLMDFRNFGVPHFSTLEIVVASFAAISVLFVRIIKKTTNVFYEKGR